ncbi:MAG: hypothetical protein J4A00_10035 [Gammaproteobacteria bacterium]|nr:hypothetical protein [Gammaproteobacteria bacterium]
MKGQIHRSGPLLEAGLNLYKASFPVILPLALIAALLAALPKLVFASGETDPSLIALSIALSILAFWPYSALLYMLDQNRYQQRGSIAALIRVLPRLPHLLLALGLYMSICILCGLPGGLLLLLPGQLPRLLGLLLLIPGLCAGMLLILFMPAVILDNSGPLKALSWCRAQIRAHWRTTFAVVLTPFLLMGGLMMLVGMTLGFIMLLGDTSQFELFDRLTSMFNNLIVALVTPLLYANLVVLYHRLKDTPERIKPLDRSSPQTTQ